MSQEEKDLLLKDFCARLPYGVKAYVKNWSKLDRKYYEGVYTVESVHPSLNNILVYSERVSVEVIVGYDDYEIKPYLFPLSSMTEEQYKEFYDKYCWSDGGDNFEMDSCSHYYALGKFDWLLKNHFDIYGLIPMGLAIDATNKNIY